MKTSKGFTLVELLIVIIIVGILAAVAIPQFTDTSGDAKVAALDANLALVRNSIELFYHQHNSTYPGVIKNHTNDAGTTAAHADVDTAFTNQLTMYSDASGNTSSKFDRSTFPYGPYIKTGLPSSPFTASAVTDLIDVGTSDVALTGEATPTSHWMFSSTTGQFIANDQAYDDR